jgi:hypothetical protein
MKMSAPDARCRTATGGLSNMRPVVAYLLLLGFSAMLLFPLLPARAMQAGLAACCKRYGKHLCVGSGDVKLTRAFPSGSEISERCPYAFAPAFTGMASTYGPVAAITLHAKNVQHTLSETYTYSLPFVPARHSILKRGPPALPA